MQRIAFAVSCLALAATALGCSDNNSATCTPGSNRACSCAAADPGTQSCGASGIWGACSCEGIDGGVHDMSLSDADIATRRAEVLATIPTLPEAMVNNGTVLMGPPDFTCIRNWDEEIGDSLEGAFYFDYGVNINSTVDLKFFPDNEVPANIACSGTCFVRTTNNAGGTPTFPIVTQTFMAWASPAWSLAGEAQVPTVTTFVRAEDFMGTNYRVTVPYASDLAGAYARNDTVYDATASTMSGLVLDCQSRSVSGVVIRVFDEAGALRALTSPKIAYGNFPTGSITETSTRADGRFAALDVAPADTLGSLMRVEAWAAIAGSRAAATMIACENVRMFGGTLSDITLRPTRTTSPASCTP